MAISKRLIEKNRRTYEYLIVAFSQAEKEQFADSEDVMAISKRLIEKNRRTYELLAE